ncbi:MAG TPA: hypothetical protein VII11_12120 [Bacteroidota bacterium]
MFIAEKPLKLKEVPVRIFRLTKDESEKLIKRAASRNVFVKRGFENNFYVGRFKGLADKTIVEVLLPGKPNEVFEEAQNLADLTERIAFLSSVLEMDRKAFQVLMGLGQDPKKSFHIIISSDFRRLSSSRNPERRVLGFTINKRFTERFEECCFENLILHCKNTSELSHKVSQTINWLYESRMEPREDAAIAKTGIALESLLVFDSSENLRKPISERSAYLLSSDPDIRLSINRTFNKFYDLRSDIVHGRKTKIKNASGLLECTDRLILLMCLIVSSNKAKWKTKDSMLEWFEQQKWGSPDLGIKFSFPEEYFYHALRYFPLT